ncbi:hypothetical protein JCM8115_003676 [Rhodotorula mucilaginosa]|nr:hypothetical protein B0A53_04951 [Rhodotorula sp. CCFEE 5036]
MTTTMSNMGKSVMRVAKNSIKGYSDTQTKIRDATSNDPWGPSGTQMAELAQLTYNQQDFVEIIEMLEKRLNDKGKNWRHVFKSLTVLDYILHAGSENVVHYFRENLYVVKTLKEFQYIDEDGKDQGANVRQKAKDVTNLLLDEKRMTHQRRARKDMRNRMAGEPSSSANDRPSRASPPPRGGKNNDDDELAAAIEASKRSAAEEANRHKGDSELEEALRLSREEDERRRRALEAGAGDNLFDEEQQRNALIDMDAPEPQQPMQTGWMSYNPYQAQQQAQMEEYMRQQQLLELQRQQEQQQMLYAQQQQAAMQAQYQQQQAYEDYMRQQQMMYMQQQQQQPNQQPIQAQPTGFGANNPFAAFAPQASPSPAPPPPQQEPASNGFESSYRPEPAPAPAPVQEQQPQRTGGGRYKTGGDERHSELARMLAGGREDGLDTFGNVGATRVPVWQQKTGQGQGPMMPQTTGLAKPLNPFGTGVTTYRPQQFNQPTGQQQQQQQNNEQPFFTI